jgi:hypothetical protein
MPNWLAASAVGLVGSLWAIDHALARVESIGLRLLRLKRIGHALRGGRLDRRRVDRRVVQLPFPGPDRRSGDDRRTLSLAV